MKVAGNWVEFSLEKVEGGFEVFLISDAWTIAVSLNSECFVYVGIGDECGVYWIWKTVFKDYGQKK